MLRTDELAAAAAAFVSAAAQTSADALAAARA